MQSLSQNPSTGVVSAKKSFPWLTLGCVAGVAALVVVLLLAWTLFVGWWSRAPLPDVSQPADLALTSGGGKYTSGLSVHITGEINGEVEVWASNWKPQRLSGRVDWRVYHDWYEPTCTLHYRPVGKVSGELEIHYQFH